MRETALNTVALMLTVYIAILIWALPHLADRYTPKLHKPFILKTAIVPFLLLLLLLFTAGALVIRPFPHLLLSFFTGGHLNSLPWLGDLAAFLILLLSVGVILGSGYGIASLFAESARLISWIDDPEDLQDVLKSAIDRSDQRIIKLALRKALSDQQAREKHVRYLIEHRDLLATDWLTRETVAIALSNFDADAAKVYADLLCTLLGKALDNDEFSRAKTMITEIFAALTHAIPWAQAHGDLLYLVGFTIWKVGEPERCKRRLKPGVDELLDGVKEHFFKQLGDIWEPLKDAQSPNGVECFAGVLNKLIVETTTINDLVHEVTEYRFCHGYLTLQKIEEIRESLKQAAQEVYELSADDYERGKVQGAADNLFIDLAVMLAELGESEETLYSFLSNLKTGNRAVHIRQKMLGTQPHKHPWLKEESYQTAIYGAFYSVRHTATGFSS